MDRATEAGGGDSQPEKGDYSICLKCGTITCFNAELKMEAVTEEELQELNFKWPETYSMLRRVQRAIYKQMIKGN
jgi:Fe2+ or Zn2+ uptake regulation protein